MCTHSYRTHLYHTLGLYSALRACKAIALRSSLQSKFTVETIFLDIEPTACISIANSHHVTYIRTTREIQESSPSCKLKLVIQ